ncbi:MAG: PQQ-like beta-propeller repeat protein [Sandaracinaceae bacterium]|jgi:hypothetical protein|nr:PQQ-like beta-propeller repeat protein [Sandaracinaceae bacterium]
MRQSPDPTPLVLTLRSTLVALDPESGAHRWNLRLPMQVRRVFPLEKALLVVLAQAGESGAIALVELSSGMVLRRIELPFDPSGAALRDGDRLFVASEHGVVCVTTDCQLVWSGSIRAVQRGLFGADNMLVVTGPDGRERAQVQVGNESSSGNAGLALRDLVCQPDLRD